MSNQFLVIQCLGEFIFIALSIAIIVYSFKIEKNIKEIKDIEIISGFCKGENIDNNILSKELGINITNESNRYEEFFEKYYLEEGQTFEESEDITNLLNPLFRISLSIAIILIIITLPSFLSVCLCSSSGHGYAAQGCFMILAFISIGRFIILSVLIIPFVVLFMKYRNNFENEFFELSDYISDFYYNEYDSFKDYYIEFFYLKENFLINVILLGANTFDCLCLIVNFIIVFKTS